MPNNVVKSPRDEYKWKRAEQIAAKAGRKGDYAYVMGIYKNMKPDHQFKKSASERDWVRIAGDILTHAAWDSEKVAAAFNAELELIEAEKEAARMTGRLAKKTLTSAMKGRNVNPTRLAQAERYVANNQKWIPKGWQQHVVKTRGVPKNPNTGKSLAERGWDIPVDKTVKRRAVSEVVPGAQARPQPKSTIYETPGGRRVTPPANTRTEKVIKTPASSAKGKTPTKDVADQTRRQVEQARAAAERAPTTPARVQAPPNSSRPSTVTKLPNEVPTSASPFAGKPPTPKTPAATVGAGARPQPQPKMNVSSATAESFEKEVSKIRVSDKNYSEGLRARARATAAARKELGAAEKALADAQARAKSAPSIFGQQSLAEETARVNRARAKFDAAKKSMKDKAKVDRGTTRMRAEAKQRRAQKAEDARSQSQRQRLEEEVRRGNLTAEAAEQQFRRSSVRNQRALDRSRPSTPTPANQPPPQASAPAQAPAQAQTAQSTAPREFANRKPAPTAPATSTAPAQAPATPVQQAASQSPGFWQQAKNTWGSMSENQRLLAVGVGGVGAGMVTSPKKQPAPPMYGPAPQAPQYYQMAPQPPAFR